LGPLDRYRPFGKTELTAGRKLGVMSPFTGDSAIYLQSMHFFLKDGQSKQIVGIK
jgi:hypothetical protein